MYLFVICIIIILYPFNRKKLHKSLIINNKLINNVIKINTWTNEDIIIQYYIIIYYKEQIKD